MNGKHHGKTNNGTNNNHTNYASERRGKQRARRNKERAQFVWGSQTIWARAHILAGYKHFRNMKSAKTERALHMQSLCTRVYRLHGFCG